MGVDAGGARYTRAHISRSRTYDYNYYYRYVSSIRYPRILTNDDRVSSAYTFLMKLYRISYFISMKRYVRDSRARSYVGHRGDGDGRERKKKTERFYSENWENRNNNRMHISPDTAMHRTRVSTFQFILTRRTRRSRSLKIIVRSQFSEGVATAARCIFHKRVALLIEFVDFLRASLNNVNESCTPF